MNIVSLALRNVGRNRRRSILSAIAIAIATSVMVMMFALIEGLKVDLQSSAFHMETGQVRIRTAAFDADEMLNPLHLSITNALEVMQLIESRPETKSLVPRIPFPTLLYKGGKTFKARGMGIDVAREEGFQSLSRSIVEGRMPAMGTRETALGVGLAKDMGLGVGDKFTVWTATASRGMNAMTLKIVGLLRFSVNTYNRFLFFAPLDTVQRLLGMQGSVTDILVILRDGEDAARAAKAFGAAVNESGRAELTVAPWTVIGIWYPYIRISDAIFTIFGLAFILLGTTVMINTTMMTIYERVREIGTMGALGMTGGKIVWLFFLESFFIGVAGSLAGMLVGVAITVPLSITGIDYSETMKNIDIGMSSIYFPILNWRSTLLAFLYSAMVTSLVSIIPSRKASRIEPVKALRAI